MSNDPGSAILLALYNRKPDEAERLSEGAALTIWEAAALGDADAARAILKRDRKAVHTRSFDGWTPLHLAAFMGHAAVARVLLDHGADIEAVAQNGIANRPLHAALAGKENPEVIDLLLEKGADVKAKAEASATPLHLAAARGNMTYTRRLLELGADPGAAMTDGKLPAAFATERGHPEVAALLNGLTAGR